MTVEVVAISGSAEDAIAKDVHEVTKGEERDFIKTLKQRDEFISNRLSRVDTSKPNVSLKSRNFKLSK